MLKKSNTLLGRLCPKEGVLSDHGVPYTLGALFEKRNVSPKIIGPNGTRGSALMLHRA